MLRTEIKVNNEICDILEGPTALTMCSAISSFLFRHIDNVEDGGKDINITIKWIPDR